MGLLQQKFCNSKTNTYSVGQSKSPLVRVCLHTSRGAGDNDSPRHSQNDHHVESIPLHIGAVLVHRGKA